MLTYMKDHLKNLPILEVATCGIVVTVVQSWIEAFINPGLHNDGEIVRTSVVLVVSGSNFNCSGPNRKGVATCIVGRNNRRSVTIIGCTGGKGDDGCAT